MGADGSNSLGPINEDIPYGEEISTHSKIVHV